MKHDITITQYFRVKKMITISVEAPTLGEAVELVREGPLTGPAFDDKGWQEQWDLRDEDIDPAKKKV